MKRGTAEWYKRVEEHSQQCSDKWDHTILCQMAYHSEMEVEWALANKDNREAVAAEIFERLGFKKGSKRFINVFTDGRIVGKVAANENLGRKFWGGLGRLSTGEWVFMLTRKVPSTLDKGWIITPEEAVMNIFESGRKDLLTLPEFRELQKLVEDKS